jgi:serine/threonine-protein kinase
MGCVYSARHRETGAVHAVKVLSQAPDPEVVARFRREAEAQARVSGAGVVPIHAAGVEKGRLYFAMDLMPGGTLGARLKAAGRLEWAEAVRLVADVARTLGRCHRAGLVHRDLKPANVLFDAAGRPCLADFGIVRDLEAATLTETGTVLGTPIYMAPEQLEGARVDARADVYALGVILHELVTGSPPWPASLSPYKLLVAKKDVKRPDMRRAVLEVPPALEAVVARALSPRAGDRHADAGALTGALDALLAKGATASDVPGRRRAVVLAFGLPALAAVGLGVFLGRSERAPAPAVSTASPVPGVPRADGALPARPKSAADEVASVVRVLADPRSGVVELEGSLVTARSMKAGAAPVDSSASAAVVEAARRRIAKELDCDLSWDKLKEPFEKASLAFVIGRVFETFAPSEELVSAAYTFGQHDIALFFPEGAPLTADRKEDLREVLEAYGRAAQVNPDEITRYAEMDRWLAERAVITPDECFRHLAVAESLVSPGDQTKGGKIDLEYARAYARGADWTHARERLRASLRLASTEQRLAEARSAIFYDFQNKLFDAPLAVRRAVYQDALEILPRGPSASHFRARLLLQALREAHQEPLEPREWDAAIDDARIASGAPGLDHDDGYRVPRWIAFFFLHLGRPGDAAKALRDSTEVLGRPVGAWRGLSPDAVEDLAKRVASVSDADRAALTEELLPD